ncbi:MAG: DNA polymerase II large subunit [Thermoplasmata archaeon]
MDTSEYFDYLKAETEKIYSIAQVARSKNLDPEPYVEIPIAEDLAKRVEHLTGIENIADIIRDHLKKYDREMASIMIAREISKKFSDSREKAIEYGIRVGLAVVTEGVLVAPIDGITQIKIKKNVDGSEYLSIYYSGPIRGAGGTGQAISVLIGDVLRREFGISRFRPRKEVIERYKEEIQRYGMEEHLQYSPTPIEIENVVSGCPVCIDGEGTIEAEISGYRDLPEIETNRIRGGMALVLAEGIIQKARKLKSIVEKLNLDGWEFLEKIISGSRGEVSENTSKFMEDVVAGRPIFSYSGFKGGFRLRYGRCRTGGLATISINPATMVIMDDFIAIGTQLKIEFPGKAGGMTSCDSVEGPIVLLKNGECVQVNDFDYAIKIREDVIKIYDNGEILIPIGEFIENNYPLKPASFTREFWELMAREKGISEEPKNFTEAFEISRKFGIPLHPDYSLFWEDLDVEELKLLRLYLRKNMEKRGNVYYIRKDERIKDILCRLGALHHESDGYIIMEKYGDVIHNLLGLNSDVEIPDKENAIEIIENISGIRIYPRGATRVGTRMGRPEKAAERKMDPAVHSLFPLGKESGQNRNMKRIIESDSHLIEVEMGVRVCPKCHRKTYRFLCDSCNTRTIYTEKQEKFSVDLEYIYNDAVNNLNISTINIPKVKGVKGLISRELMPEPLEKGILRAIHDVYVYKDGTARFDMSNLAITHFKPYEIGIDANTAIKLGYSKDTYGNEITRDDQIIQIFPQDLIISRKGAEYLFRISKFVDDLLERYYKVPSFYNLRSPEELIGHLVIGISPHTSGGVLGRIIGITEANVCFAHPFFHAAKRRNCDGDEDAVILLMDALLNFSRHYLPSSRGGMMDAPLFISIKISPTEIDKEALNVDVSYSYPLNLFKYSYENKKASEIDEILTIKSLLKKNPYEGYGFTNDTKNINIGVIESRYKYMGSMQEKTEAQLSLGVKIRAVDVSDMASRVISHHFLPDMIGNMRKFGTQEFICTKCHKKYRRMPLSGKCTCGGNLKTTSSKGSITKYLELSKKISSAYNVNNYTKQRILFVEMAIRSLFIEEEDNVMENRTDNMENNGKNKRLEDFL